MRAHTTKPSLWISLIPVAVLVGLLAINVYLSGDESSSGPNQLALLVAAGVSAAIGHWVLGMDYAKIEVKAIRSIGLAMHANLILLVVGVLIGIWIMAGIVPTMIYYGLRLINPGIFLAVACLSCSLVAISIGSSWSTMGTIGVALIGIGTTLGFPPPMVAGAIISGAYFGDKLSPLSDTTNLAPAIAGTDLFTHVRHLLYTTMPAYAIALAGFALIGVFYTPEEYNPSFVQEVTGLIKSNFSVGPHTLITPVVTLLLVLRRMPALPALTIGALLGAGEAALFQPHLFTPPGESFSLVGAYNAIVTTAHSGFTIETGDARFDDLFSRGGLLNMLNTVLLIITAMFFGGAMEATGMLHRIAASILQLVRGTGSLVAATIASCIVFNFAAPDQYLSIVVPGRMFREAYARYGLHPKNLSRALEDGGTVTSVLVPWNTCAAFGSATLGVATIDYLPYCFFNLLCPVVGVLLPALGLSMAYLSEEEKLAAVTGDLGAGLTMPDE